MREIKFRAWDERNKKMIYHPILTILIIINLLFAIKNCNNSKKIYVHTKQSFIEKHGQAKFDELFTKQKFTKN
jgi:hypothetical protein